MFGSKLEHLMMHNFITDVGKGGDLLKLFEQSDLLNNACPMSHIFLRNSKETFEFSL